HVNVGDARVAVKALLVQPARGGDRRNALHVVLIVLITAGVTAVVVIVPAGVAPLTITGPAGGVVVSSTAVARCAVAEFGEIHLVRRAEPILAVRPVPLPAEGFPVVRGHLNGEAAAAGDLAVDNLIRQAFGLWHLIPRLFATEVAAGAAPARQVRSDPAPTRGSIAITIELGEGDGERRARAIWADLPALPVRVAQGVSLIRLRGDGDGRACTDLALDRVRHPFRLDEIQGRIRRAGTWRDVDPQVSDQSCICIARGIVDRERCRPAVRTALPSIRHLQRVSRLRRRRHDRRATWRRFALEGVGHAGRYRQVDPCSAAALEWPVFG